MNESTKTEFVRWGLIFALIGYSVMVTLTMAKEMGWSK